MNVLSLFDGMSCGKIALKELGIITNKYYASEIDKHAIAQTQLNFPNTIQLGSVVDVDVSKLDMIDLLIGGSPCQSFSFAGKRNGMSTTENEEIYTLDRYLQLKSEGFQFEGQSYLFWEYMRILTDIRKYNPDVKFLLENVEMGDKWERVLSEAIGVFGVHINSALVSAQNRKRIYWTNIRVKQVGLFGELHSDIPQPKDEGILLKDILEEEVDEKYYLSEKMIKCLDNRKNISQGYEFKPGNGSYKANTILCKECQYSTCNFIKEMDIIPCDFRFDEGLRLKNDGKTGSLLSRARNDESCGQLVMINQVCIQQRARGSNKGGLFKDKCPTLTSNSFEHNNHVLQIKEATSKGFVEINPGECFDFENPKSKTRRGRKMDVKYNSLMAQNMSFMNYTNDYRIRRLTPTECARLQTIPEWYKWSCSDTQQYKMLGNCWTVKVIMHILKYLK